MTFALEKDGIRLATAPTRADLIEDGRKKGLVRWYGPPVGKNGRDAPGEFERLADGVKIERVQP